MKLIGILFSTLILGVITAKLLLQTCLSFINACSAVIGIVRGKVERKRVVVGFLVSLGYSILFAVLLNFVPYIATKILSFDYSKLEIILYWVFSAISIVYWIPQTLRKIKIGWQLSNIPGALDELHLARQQGKSTEEQGT